MNSLEHLNQALFLQINSGSGSPAWLLYLATSIADGLIYLIPLTLLVMWCWGDSRQRELLMKVCLVTFLALGVNQLIGLVWQHPRPFMVGIGHTWIAHAADSSFPSDHATVFASVAFTLLVGGAIRSGTAALFAGVIVSWARIFVGVHFPFDMLGAVVIAVLTCAAITPIWRRIGRMVTTLAEQLYRIIFARPIHAGWIRR